MSIASLNLFVEGFLVNYSTCLQDGWVGLVDILVFVFSELNSNIKTCYVTNFLFYLAVLEKSGHPVVYNGCCHFHSLKEKGVQKYYVNEAWQINIRRVYFGLKK